MKKPNIDALQTELIVEFTPFHGDKSLIFEHIIEVGKEIGLSATDRKNDYLVAGCLSNVWLIPSYKGENIFFRGDSDALVTRGLVALCIRIFSGQPVKDIVEAKLFFPHKIGLPTLLSTQRQHGIELVFLKMQHIAQQYLYTTLR